MDVHRMRQRVRTKNKKDRSKTTQSNHTINGGREMNNKLEDVEQMFADFQKEVDGDDTRINQ